LPQNGDEKDFDFNLSIAKDDVGCSSDNLAFEGTGKYEGKEFEFRGPIKEFKLFYGLSEKYNHDHSYNALIFKEEPFKLMIESNDIMVKGTDLDTSQVSELANAITENLTRIKTEV